MTEPLGGSPSIENPDYWWFRVRARLLETVFRPHVRTTDLVLDVGSADGPSASWLRDRAKVFSIDVDPRGLENGGAVASLTALPFRDSSFDVVSAFDVIEHIEDEHRALTECLRVLRPGGLLLLSVPAYEWAWTSFDAHNCHHRRYTRRRVERALYSAGFDPIRLTHGFSGVFPFFALTRLATRFRERHRPPVDLSPGEVPPLPHVNRLEAKVLSGLSELDFALLTRRDLPFGSSIFALSRKSVG